MNDKFYLTEEGLKKIQSQYEELKKLKALKIKSEVPQILHSDDLNSEYMVFQEDLEFLETRIRELENILRNVEIIKTPPKEKQNIVALGATVTLEEQPSKLINEFMIVGMLESNPAEGKISSDSPVGKALLGHKVGEEVLITSPIKIVYKIKKIKYLL